MNYNLIRKIVSVTFVIGQSSGGMGEFGRLGGVWPPYFGGI